MSLVPFRYQAVATVEKYFPRASQRRVRGWCLLGIVVGVGAVVVQVAGYVTLPLTYIAGGSLILFGLYIESVLVTLYTNTIRYAGLQSVSGQGNHTAPPLTYDVAKILLANPHDLTRSLFESTYGSHIYVRSEITAAHIAEFLTSPRTLLTPAVCHLPTDRTATLVDVVSTIMAHDHALVAYLQKIGVTPSTVLASARLVMETHYAATRRERWWGRDNLSQRGALGRSLSLGAWRQHIPHTTPVLVDASPRSVSEQMTVDSLAAALLTRRGANILFTSPDSINARTVCAKLQQALVAGTALGAVNGMTLVYLDHESILAGVSTDPIDPTHISDRFYDTIASANAAGTITFVCTAAPTHQQRYAALGVSLYDFLADICLARQSHLIIIATPHERQLLHTAAPSLVARCTEIVETFPTSETYRTYMLPTIFATERTAQCIFSTPAIAAISDSICTYSTPNQENAEEMIAAIAAACATGTSPTLITHSAAERVLAHILNVPIGPVGFDEQALLLNLEDALGEFVVGQAAARVTIAAALRRSRALHIATKQPIASFFFFGPSGVGKTEMAKAFATLYMGSEQALCRIDMAEYATADSVAQLLGTTDSAGRLAEILATTPRTILLLDEFEKAHPTIQDIFLTILDEGTFTNGQGDSVSARQAIIIATSNAASDLIVRTHATRQTNHLLDVEIMQHIITKGIVRAELLGRFTDTVLFEPLTPAEVQTAAARLTHQLCHTMATKGYVVVIPPSTVTLLIDRYYTAEFGLRPVRHAIEHELQDIIATAIIRGAIKPGDTLTITPDLLPTPRP